MNNRRGVTLIELLVVVSVLGIVLIPILGIFGFATRQFGSQTGRAKTIMLANQAMNAMAKDIHNCISVQADANGNPTNFTLAGNTDASGNYVPISQNGTLTYQPLMGIRFRLSNANDTAASGTTLWREHWEHNGNPNLLSGLFGSGGSWVGDTSWSQQPGGTRTNFANTTALTFITAGMPANTVRVSLTMTDAEGSQTSSYTVSRSVYLSNHN